MRFLSIIALAGALAACGSNPSDEAETTPEEQGQMTEEATLDDKALAALQQCEQVEPSWDGRHRSMRGAILLVKSGCALPPGRWARQARR